MLFAPGAVGNLALVIYEFGDAQHLGVQPPDAPDEEDVSAFTACSALLELTNRRFQRLYVCDIPAVDASLCKESQLGTFIVTAPKDEKTSIYTTMVTLNGATKSSPVAYQVSKTGFYCVGAVPLTTEGAEESGGVRYTGVVDFRNVFVGHLPAAEYPKILVSPFTAYDRTGSLMRCSSSTKDSPSSTLV